jgi:CRP-like cAMP-binding protein
MSSLDGLAPFVQKLATRVALGEKVRKAIASLCFDVEHVTPKRDIIPEGDPQNRQLRILLDGAAGQFSQLRDGGLQIDALYFGGDALNLAAVLLPGHCFGVQALSACTVAKIPQAVVDGLTNDFPTIARAFSGDLAANGSILAEWVTNIGRRDATARLAHLLCEIVVRLTMIGRCNGLRFELPLTQAQLGDALGLTSVHVNRVTQSLKKLGVISAAGRTVEICDWKELQNIAGFDPCYLHLESIEQLGISSNAKGNGKFSSGQLADVL